MTDLGDEDIHGGDGLAVVVEAHVKGLDLLGVVVKDDGAAKHLGGQVLLVLGPQVQAPVDVLVL